MIVLIAPYEELYDLAIEVTKDLDLNLDIHIELGELSEGVKLAKYWESKGAEVVISRGGTYNMIKEEVSIPTVEIKVNAYDVLRQFHGLVGYKKTIGIGGYRNVIYGCDVIEDVLGVNLIKVEIETEKSGFFQVAKVINQYGINIFIGDTIGAESAAKLGLESRLIKSGKEAIAYSINEAFRIAEALRVEKARSEQIRMIIDFVHDGVVAVDRKGKITVLNKIAQEIFKRNSAQSLGEKIEKVIPNTKLYQVMESGVPQLDCLQDVEDIKIATNRVPIVVDNKVLGAVATFKDVTLLQKTEQKIRRKLSDKGFVAKYNFDNIIYKSKNMEEVLAQAKKYAKLESTITIFGETGTGKELFAQSIHNNSSRKRGPFVAINCAALTENLLESELFGYAEGAFTGARKGGKIGLFELAHNGTIFLDEIGDVSLNLQSSLLRVLQEKKVMRIGDDKLIPIDVRIICATNKDLLKQVDDGKFREDLFYRINVLPITIPPLRERIEDIEVLVPHFIRKYSIKNKKKIMGITDKAMYQLKTQTYNGNVRELESIIERACALCDEDMITEMSIKFYQRVRENKSNEIKNADSIEIKPLKHMELKYIKMALEKSGGNVSQTAKKLGINRSTLWRKLKKDKSS